MAKTKPHKDLTGQKFGRLTVLKYLGESKWLCKCDCGTLSTPRGYNLVKGISKSCGCYQKEKIGKLATKHGMAGTRIYKTWHNMKSRCNNPNATKYEIYGGKGIKVCDEWMDFENFYRWAIENGYNDSLSIDRIDGNKDYEPSNCRWVDYKTQNNNKSQNHLITYKGRTQNISQWARELGMDANTLGTRLARGWNIEKAVTTPVIEKLERDEKGRFLNA